MDAISLAMIAPLIRGARVLCLGYPDHPDGVDTVAWLKGDGAVAVDVVDVIPHRGIEIIVDLNEPWQWERRYDLVINPGTLEHCFNVGQAWSNAWHVVAVGGYALIVAPVSLLNHGFWNVNPVSVFEWCGTNGGRVVAFTLSRNGAAGVEVKAIPNGASGRGYVPEETVMYALCIKESDVAFRWPTQGAYRR